MRLPFAAVGVALAGLTLVPLWGIGIPILVDLPEQLAVAKLFHERLAGVSSLDLEISGYLGYRFFPLFAAAAMRALGWLGLGLVHLPTLVAIGLVLLNSALLLVVARQWLPADRFDASWLLALLPLASVYSSAFYLGLVNYVPAIGFLVLAISCAERWFQLGGAGRLAGFAVSLGLVYVCHPFVVGFWIAWAACRLAVQMATGGAIRWRRVAALAVPTVLVIAYHLVAAPQALAVETSLERLFPPWPHWLRYRALAFVNGEMFGLEYSLPGHAYAVAVLALVVAGLVHMARARPFPTPPAQLLLTALLFYFLTGAPDEGALPAPRGLGLEYDTRFASTAPVVLMVAACIYAWNAGPPGSGSWRRIFGTLGAIALVVGLAHLVDVRRSMESFDAFAQASMPAIERGSDAISGRFASKFNTDGSYIRHYRCLFVPDCVPRDSWFVFGNDFGLYAVRLVRPP